MEKNSAISTINIILKGSNSACPFSLVSIILLCIIVCWIVALVQDLYSGFRFLIQTAWKGNNSGAKVQTPKPCSVQNVNNSNKLYQAEVEKVMEKLGIFCDPHQKSPGLDEIATLFSEEEPSSEEVKEAFDMFDENNDGFIDAEELEKVLCTLGFTEMSKVECQRMIAVFDDNRDGLIDFAEFGKLVENSFG